MCVLNVKFPEELKPPNNGTNGTGQSKADKEKQREKRERLVLWREPVLTVKYSTLEMVDLLRTYEAK